MKKHSSSIKAFLSNLLKQEQFDLGKDSVLRRWNDDRDICCAIALKKFSDERFVTVETGFISPQIQNWSGLEASEFPLPSMGNGFGICFRFNDLDINDGFLFPPGGWSVSKMEDRERFQNLLEYQFLPKLKLLVKDLLTWDGWVSHFREEVRKGPCGRGIAWSMLGYSMLASPGRTTAEISEVIEEHARQDASNKIGNRIESAIVQQRDLLRKRELTN